MAGLPTLRDYRESLLEILRDEDDQWLWEPVWDLNHKYPEIPIEGKVALVRQVVDSLEANGEIELQLGDWPKRTTRPLPPGDRARLREEDMPWSQPEATDLFVVITLNK